MQNVALNSNCDVSSYDYLWRLSPDRWAWEFLRRNYDFRLDAAGRSDNDISERPACPGFRFLRSRVPQTIADRWGLVFMPDPDRDGVEADAVWNLHAFPDQIEISCSPRARDQQCEIWNHTVPFCEVTHITDPVGREFLLVRRDRYVVQVRCTGISLLGLEPVLMKLTISEVDGYERQVKLQKAAFELFGEKRDHSVPQWTKTTQVLRDGLIALDCQELGMNRRDIAVVLFGAERVNAEWAGPSQKHTIRYLVKKAEALRDGGYLTELLGGGVAPDKWSLPQHSDRGQEQRTREGSALAFGDIDRRPTPAVSSLQTLRQVRKGRVGRVRHLKPN
ncbi:MAG: hypothetical protein B7X53_01200 [Hyphomonas sp. 34-62-18]|nr:MAG: hypothetical protein B7X53_01200 [Hyphomonas sp. 34-62-18]